MEKRGLLQSIVAFMIGRKARFKVGDSVQLLNGGPLMVVKRVYRGRKMNEPLLECQWNEGKTIRKSLFRDDQLKMFDWYHPHE